MNRDHKYKIVSKAYLILISLITTAVLMVGTTLGSYVTQSEHTVGFSAEKPTKIYFNQSELFNKTLFQPQMTQIDGAITSIFTLSNYDLQVDPDAKKVQFHIRAFVLRQDGYVPSEDAPVVQIMLSDNVDSVVYSSKAEMINKKTDFYKTNEKNGEFFRFYQTQQQDQEKVYTLEGEDNCEITFTLMAKDVDFDADDLFVCIDLVR